MNLAETIEFLRKNGLIRFDSEIAKIVDIPKSNLSLMLSGKRKVPDYVFDKINQHFKLDSTILVDNKVSKNTTTIPIYDTIATAGANENISQLNEQPAYYDSIRGYEDCDFGIHIYGNSMYPTIESGCLILCKKINDKQIILFGEIYLLRTSDYLLVKRLRKSPKNGSIECHSDNIESEQYDSFDLPIDKIKELYLVKGIIKKIQS